MLGNFFKPKWQHKDPKVRIQGLANLAGDSVELIKIAQTDPDTTVKMEAVLRLNHIPTLVQIGHSAGSIGERARQRVIALAGLDHRHDQALVDVFAWLQQNPMLIQSIARDTTRDIHLRRHAIKSTNLDDLQLFDIACKDPSKEIQLLAATGLKDLDKLTAVDKLHGRANKRLHQLVKERVEQEKLQLAQQAQVTSLLAEAQTLGQKGSWEQEKTRARVLEQRCKTLSALINVEQQQYLTSTLNDFQQRLAEYETQQAEQAALLAQQAAEAAAQQAEAQRQAEEAQALAAAQQAQEQQRQAEEKRQRKQQQDLQSQTLQSLHQTLQQLESHLENEQYGEAIEQHRALTQAVKDSKNVPKQELAFFKRRLNVLSPYIREIQDWRRWGTDQVRRQLIETAENLRETESIDPATRAKQVQSLRQEWRKLSQIEPAQPHALWKTFDTTVSAAYEPSKQHFIEQAQQRETHLADRHAICAALETLFTATDWQQAAWRELQVQVNQLRKQWKDAGTVSHKDWQSVNERFNHAMDALENQFKAERIRNWESRQALVEEAKALLENPATEQAIKQAKVLQNTWQITLASRHADEQQLWKQFREPIDALFARAREERQQKHDVQSAQQAEQARLAKEQQQREQAKRQAALEKLTALAAQSAENKATAADAETQAHNQTAGELLCLQLEILLDIASPAAYQKARLEYQIAQMGDAMRSPKNTQQSPAEQAMPLLQQWYAIGSLPADSFGEQTARIETIRQTLLSA